ncbi:MAG: hypothetical protein JNM36_09115 [Chitinophagales bacterium]|nr:hypothetical protein [Chitinophagales bacterium]HNI44548.1 hypothetical protein [Chitinophagales bacterium]
MSLLDAIVFFAWLVLLYMLLLMVREWRYKDQTCAKYLLPAFSFKVLGVLLFDAIYVFYYHGGDTLDYYRYSLALYKAIHYEPFLGLKVFFSEANQFEPLTDHITRQLEGYYFETNTFTVVKISTLLNFFTFGQFWATSLLFATLGFIGLWSMFRVFSHLYPHLEREMAWVALFIPSVAFWGSGIMKDTISMSALGVLLYLLYKAIILRQNIVFSLLLLPFVFSAVWSTKPYIIMAFAPAFLLWVILRYKNEIEERRLRIAVFMVIMGGLVLMYYQMQSQITAWSNELFFKFVRMAMGFHSWHSFLSQQGGGYSLGEVEFTVGGVLSKFPQSVMVTLFRPFLYEARSPVMLITAIESALFLFFTLYVLLKTRFIGFFVKLGSQPFALFAFVFSLLFAFAVGFTSYNFGALARYKIPCMPFYLAVLLVVLRGNNRNNEKRQLVK